MALITQSIPLFPLDVVLFPGMVLPLHIFELRYQQMVRDCVASGEPFGLVWAEEEPLTIPTDRPLVGTTAIITEVEPLPDGRFNISTVGNERFLVRSFSYEQPYLVGDVEPYPASGAESPAVAECRPTLIHLFRRYVELLDKVADNEVSIEAIPDDATTLAYIVAVYYQCQNWRKQELLAIESIPELMRHEIELLRVENPLIEQIHRYQALGEIPPLVATSLAVYGLN